MINFISRLLTITFFFTALTIGSLYVYFQKSTTQVIDALLIVYADLPIGLWILQISFILSLLFTLWSITLEQKKDRAIREQVQKMLNQEPLDLTTRRFPPRVERDVQELASMIHIQRKSLQRITDERAQADDKLIQEQVVRERQRLARELHDSVSQQLFAASMLLSSMTENEDTDEKTANRLIRQIEQIVQQAQLEMRALLLHLRPIALKNNSLKQGLEELLEELIQKVNFTIRYTIEDVPLSKGAEDHLFRIAQETLSNALRHAKATEVDVLFIQRDRLAIFRVQDNGIGFALGEEQKVSYGLQNVQERTIEVGGHCQIVSVPSQGTIVEVQLPLLKEGTEDD